MEQTIVVVQGDTRFALELQLWESLEGEDGSEDGHPIDISSMESVVLHVYRKGELVDSHTMLAMGDTRNGKTVNDFWGSTWSEKGVYKGNVEITYLDGGVKTMENTITFRVKRRG
jgi:hypothetical protein